MTFISSIPEAVVITNLGGFIQSMNGSATTLLSVAPRLTARHGQIGSLFVKGRVAIFTALREVLVGGPPGSLPQHPEFATSEREPTGGNVEHAPQGGAGRLVSRDQQRQA